MVQGEGWSPTVVQPGGTDTNTVFTGEGTTATAPKRSGFKKWAILAVFILLFGGSGSYFLFASHAGTAYLNGKIWTGYYTMSPTGTDLAYTYLPANAEAQATVMSPDGTQIAYQTLRTTDTVQLGIEKVNETHPENAKIVGNFPGDNVDIAMQWSQDGNWLATHYSQAGKDGYDSYVYLVHPNGSDGHTVPNLTTSSFAWMPDSQHLIYPSADGLSLCVITIDGTDNTCHAIQNTSGATVSGNFRANYVAASQDGTQAAVISYDNQTDTTMGPSSNVYTVNLDGTGLKQLTHFPQPDQLQQIIWSPDGQKIAFMVNSSDANNPGGVYTMNTDGSQQTHINNSMYIPSLSWQYVPAGSDSNPPPVLPGDKTPPTVTMTSPTDGATITNSLPVTVTATDNVGVTKVELYVDGALKATDSTSPYNFTVTTANLNNTSKHTLVAKAYDAANNSSVTPVVTLNTAYSYNPVTPVRIADTRANSGYANAGQTIGAGKTINVQITGKGGVPATGVGAVLLNITETSVTAGTYITAYPTGSSRPATANLNLIAGQVANSQVTTAVGSNGMVTLYNAAGSTNVIVEVEGYFSSTGSTYKPLTPTRISDTRKNSGHPNAGQTLAANGGSETVQVSKAVTIPANATAVVLEETALNQTGTGYLTLYPAGVARPTATNVTYLSGQTLTKEVTVKLGTNSSFVVANTGGSSVNVISDLTGYYVADNTGAHYVPIAPTRITDTRTTSGKQNAGKHLTAGGSITVNTLVSPVIPSGTQAVTTAMDALGPTASTYFTVYPTGGKATTTSVLNALVGKPGFNEVIAPLNSTGNFNLYNAAGTTDALVDAIGYYY